MGSIAAGEKAKRLSQEHCRMSSTVDALQLQHGFHVNDVVWRYCEGVELAGAVEETTTAPSPEQFSAAAFFGW